MTDKNLIRLSAAGWGIVAGFIANYMGVTYALVTVGAVLGIALAAVIFTFLIIGLLGSFAHTMEGLDREELERRALRTSRAEGNSREKEKNPGKE